MVRGRHAKKRTINKKWFSLIVVIMLVLGGIWYCQQPVEESNYSQKYQTLEGQIASVGDETVLVRLDDNREYLISIAAKKRKGDDLLLGNHISVQYSGQLDENYHDIQDVQVASYTVSAHQIKNGGKDRQDKTIPTHVLSSYVQNMTLEEKIAQLMIVRCPESEQVELVEQYQFGGYILFADDFKNQTKNEVIDKISSYQDVSKINMFIGVDEEGGTVVRVSQYLRNKKFQSPQQLYKEGGLERIEEDAEAKSQFLLDLGINLNFAPVCDVSTDPDDFMYERSFGQDADATSLYVSQVVQTMKANQMGSVLKHFPGYGNNDDSHDDVIYDTRSYESLKTKDFLPFQAGIDEGADMILVNHNIINDVDSSSPASLSPRIHKILRENLDYDGIIITDDLAMSGVRKLDSDDNNAVRAIQAGNDMIISSDAENQYQAILDAVGRGDISKNQIDLSVLRILAYKYDLGIIE